MNGILLLLSIVFGFFFATGLGISGMMNADKVKNFLDITGTWDPSLALVMGGALLVSLFIFPIILKREEPIFEEEFSIPTRTQITPRLVIGSAIFGVGWGLGGFCPGPAVSNLAIGGAPILLFISCMVFGMWLSHVING